MMELELVGWCVRNVLGWVNMEKLKESIKIVLDAGLIVGTHSGYLFNKTNGPKEYAINGDRAVYCYEDDESLNLAIDWIIEQKDQEL